MTSSPPDGQLIPSESFSKKPEQLKWWGIFSLVKKYNLQKSKIIAMIIDI
jgi:hypothetical protein